MFRINPFKPFREEKHVPNKVRASVRTHPISVSQPSVITKKVVNSDSNGLSSTGVDNIKTKMPQPMSNTKNDRVLFANDHVAGILGFSDLQWGNILITTVYFVEGLGHNLFSVGQFCDSDLEVALRRNACFVRNLEGVDLSKDEAPEVIKTFLKRITVLLQSPVIIIRTDNGTKFKNQVLKEYFDSVGISHQVSSVRKSQQNVVVERRNQTLVEAAKTMLIFSRALLFLWAEAIATACFTQNFSIIHRRFNKTPYELINSRKPDISFLYVFRALCYPKNNHEDIGKLGAKGDIGFFIGYSADSCAYRVYNQRTKKIMETDAVFLQLLLN
nr:integrase, catalytic region, zinc finger, CCHC-type, peptidase aspartic, catalytic [Tanacetum cinerariifolium]